MLLEEVRRRQDSSRFLEEVLERMIWFLDSLGNKPLIFLIFLLLLLNF